MRRRDSNGIDEKLKKVTEAMNPSGKQMDQFEDLMNKYKGKSTREIEEEMARMINSFSREEKAGLIQKLQMLKLMSGILDERQKRQVNLFIKLLSK